MAIDNKNINVLVTDDDNTIRTLLEALLSNKDYNVDTAEDGDSTLRKVEEKFYNVAILDYTLPDTDGVLLSKLLKEKSKDTEVIILTGNASLESAIEAIKEDIFDYIPKTSDHDKLLDTLQGALEKQALIFKNREYLWNLKTQKIELEKLNKFKDGLIGMISHDLRSPICSIKGLSQSLLDGFSGKLNKKQKEIVGTKNNIIDTMTELINNLLDMRQIQAGILKMKKKPANLEKDVIKPTVARLSHQLNEKKLKIKIDCERKLPKFNIDPPRISQVIQNLLQNAIKFTPPEGELFITASVKDENYIEIRIKDTGKGIPPDSLNTIFEIFYTTASNSEHTASGRGLGLAICKELIKAHKGDIWAESEGIDKGSTLVILLPYSKK